MSMPTSTASATIPSSAANAMATNTAVAGARHKAYGVTTTEPTNAE